MAKPSRHHQARTRASRPRSCRSHGGKSGAKNSKTEKGPAGAKDDKKAGADTDENEEAAVQQKGPSIGAKLADETLSLAVDPNNREYQNWLRKVKVGNPALETNQQF